MPLLIIPNETSPNAGKDIINDNFLDAELRLQRVESGAFMYSGNGVPDNDFGNSNDIYVNEDDFSYWRKNNGVWSHVAFLNGPKGEAGKTVHTGTTDPPPQSLGVNEDFYYNPSTFLMYGPKANNTWPAGVSLKGAKGVDGNKILSGAENPPPASLGNEGDYYYHTASSSMYGPKTGGSWSGSFSLKGDTGVAGKTVLSGSGSPPANSVGVDGDFYYNPTTSVMYGAKAGGAWPAGVSLKGLKGDKGDRGDVGSPEAVGSIKIWAATGSVLPDSTWMYCRGQAISRTTYSALFSLIGTTYGSGNGSTTFNLPDIMGRTVVGSGTGASLTARELAAKAGAETHMLVATEAPRHSHSAATSTNGDHTHTQTGSSAANTTTGGAAARVTSFASGGNNKETTLSGDHTHTIAADLGNTDGTTTPHNNMQPYTVLDYVIKVI